MEEAGAPTLLYCMTPLRCMGGWATNAVPWERPELFFSGAGWA